MMKRKIMAAVCCAMIVFALTACSLAREDAGGNPHEDKMIGVYITTEYLDLFEFEGYLNNNLGNFRGGEIVMDGNTDKYQGRLYATLMPRTLTSEETGETTEIMEYVFENIEGIPYFAPTVQDDRGNYTSSMSDDGISDGHMAINHGDDKNSITMEGTLYVLPASSNVYYPNPVYQSEDGRVYLVAGSGISSSGVHGEGSVMSQTLSADYTVTENGKSKTDSFSMTLSVSFMFAPEKIIVLQMDADGGLLSRTEYSPEALPDEFRPESKTAYLIVETKKRDYSGTEKITRELYGSDAESFDAFYAREDGICVKHWTQIKWTE